MSVKEDLALFHRREDALNEELSALQHKIDDVEAEKNTLIKKQTEFSSRTSSLAKKLLLEVKGNLSIVEHDLAVSLAEKERIENELAKISQMISERMDGISFYIEEQVSQMVHAFFHYVNNHFEELGSNIITTFHPKEELRTVQDRYGDYQVPTGNVGIFCANGGQISCIAISKDFYFKDTLYTIKRNENYDCIRCTYTGWFNAYLKSFYLALVNTINKNFPFYDNFTFTTDFPDFTLELV